MFASFEFEITTESLTALEQAEHASYLAEARNPETPAFDLEALAEDENTEIREAVAANPSTPFEVIARLMEDEDMDVMGAAFGNPSGPGSLVREQRGARGIDPKEVAVQFKRDLRKAFPGIKFSTRATGSTGPIDISWTDGPSEDDVEDVLNGTREAMHGACNYFSLYRSTTAA